MKLVDILALEMKKWPHALDSIHSESIAASVFLRGRKIETPEYVYEWQWKAALDSLKSSVSAIAVGASFEVMKGSVDWYESDKQFIGKKCIVRSMFINALDVEMAAVEFDDGCCLALRADLLKSIRTAEQIADEIRQTGINAILAFLITLPWNNEQMAEAIYDAGYRKFEIVDESECELGHSQEYKDGTALSCKFCGKG